MTKWLILALMLSAAACTRIPRGQTAVDAVDVIGNHAVDDDDIEAKLATAATPKFMGLFRGVVYEYDVYDRFTLAYDLARVERYYRARGYYDARARAGRVVTTSDHHVRVEIVVEEGEPVRIGEVRWHSSDPLPASDARAMQRAARGRIRAGAILDEDALADAKKRVLLALENRGYAKANVEARATVDVATHRAVVDVDVRPAENA